ncbi:MULTISPECIES: NADH:flavin oxidoreductase [unclassified Rhodococcus (in: high G+C Gram-positive bacteria)]|uniref:NADH:flavin oxidoreductase n=1 Tax=unclassified Rhodococcus (in: high G+C Gram-positive bacteria) TaxID=192944 RepID=UPI001FF755F9|nr:MULTISPECIES: NADH:flavin oxidoreductase [unclassified Rhodococcus (in: high G+C Gram-positive bacteria)]
MAPMTRAFSPGGVPRENVAEYYRKRAAGGTSLIITEGTLIPDPAAGPDSRVPHLHGDESLEGWKGVVDAVHAEGSAIIPQLWHLGVERGASPRFNPEVVTVSPSGIALDGSPVGREFTAADLEEQKQFWVDAAVNAKKTGFDGVELHGAHGYLLDEFLWEQTNTREDGYGGSLEARTRFPAEVVAAIRAAVGPEFAIVYRFSQWKSGHYDARLAQTPQQLERILAPLVHAGVDVLHPSTRRHWEPAFPELSGVEGERGLAGWTKSITGLPTITVGSVGLDQVFTGAWGKDSTAATTSLDPLLAQFERGEFDIVAVGRALLSDPEWVNKVQQGRLDDRIPFAREHITALN